MSEVYPGPHELKPGYSFFSALRLPDVLTAGRWLSRSGCDYTPGEASQLLPKPKPPPPPSRSLTEKYGTCTEIVHYGRSSTVRIYVCQQPTRQLHAVKIFRRSSRPWVVNRHYFEQTLSTTVHHRNLLRTLDTIYNANDELCLVMEYCVNGTLRSLVTRDEYPLPRAKADRYLKQILAAVSFLHGHGIAHRDLTLENILLTEDDTVKVADFGSAEWIPDWDDASTLLSDTSSSSTDEQDVLWREMPPGPPEPKPRDALPYLAPEEFVDQTLDARATDVWAVGVIYMVMRGRRFPWRQASAEEDERYGEYLCGRRSRNGYPPFEALGEARCRNVIYAMLDPNSQRRITASEALRSEWLHGVRL